MSDYILHENATVRCMHTGQATPTPTDQRVKVGGQKVVTQSTTHSISGCSLPTQAGGPCVTAQWITAATRVKASNIPVLLKSSQATCTPTGTGLNVLSTQMKVKAT